MIDQEARDLAVHTAQIADAMKASDILVLHVGDVLALTEYFVVASAPNRRLVDAIVEEIEAKVREATGRSPIRVEGAREHQWVLIDYGDVIVHVFLTEIREFYEIERLYKDVPKVDWDGGSDDLADDVEPTGTD
jgi:ribosome-associated protein